MSYNQTWDPVTYDDDTAGDHATAMMPDQMHPVASNYGTYPTGGYTGGLPSYHPMHSFEHNPYAQTNFIHNPYPNVDPALFGSISGQGSSFPQSTLPHTEYGASAYGASSAMTFPSAPHGSHVNDHYNSYHTVGVRGGREPPSNWKLSFAFIQAQTQVENRFSG
ncbi:hypothetical protein IAR55_004364 [Kwoniella newhampshirensis]|uniref:Uncharacterized protein n=1 Tax=Kwoniella newhampshirensis TaxID=1651941 RepID=A0AAW0YK19_9TREE